MDFSIFLFAFLLFFPNHQTINNIVLSEIINGRISDVSVEDFILHLFLMCVFMLFMLKAVKEVTQNLTHHISIIYNNLISKYSYTLPPSFCRSRF